MVINNPSATDYVPALKKLLPQGSYWDALLADSCSDVSVICAARAEELAEIRERINRLQQESYPGSAEETISDWERIYLGYTNETLSLTQRRDLLLAQKNGSVSINTLKNLAATYGCSINRIEYPYSSVFCGHSFIGQSYMGSPAVLSVVFIHAEAPGSVRQDFERAIESTLLANQILFFFYNGGNE